MTARIQSDAAAVILGLSRRAVQMRAIRGEIPGAAKIFGTWTFDPDKLAAFIRGEESKCASRIFTRGAKPIGSEPRLTDAKYDKAYEQTILKLLGKSETTGGARKRRK